MRQGGLAFGRDQRCRMAGGAANPVAAAQDGAVLGRASGPELSRPDWVVKGVRWPPESGASVIDPVTEA